MSQFTQGHRYNTKIVVQAGSWVYTIEYKPRDSPPLCWSQKTDNVPTVKLWQALEKHNIYIELIKVVKSLYSEVKTEIEIEIEFSIFPEEIKIWSLKKNVGKMLFANPQKRWVGSSSMS